MPSTASKLRVLIATTNGPVEVLLLTEEDAAIGRCVACIGGTTETADIAAAYHAFVVRPTGVVESRFGPSCYRLDVSGRIDAGSSWQLGVLAAHGLLAAGRLAQENDTADAVLWATGSVRPVDLTVGGVGHVPEKIANSLDRLKRERVAGRRVLLALPAANATEMPPTLASELAALGIELITLAHVQPLFDALAMKLPDGLGKGPVKTPGNAPGPAPSAPPPAPAVAATPRRRLGLMLGAAVAAIACIAATSAYLLNRPASPPPPSAVAPRESALLVPEQVPFVSGQEQSSIRDGYLPAPNYKALALRAPTEASTLYAMAFVTGQPSQEAAEAAALAECQKKIPDSLSQKKFYPCELYASGNFIARNFARPPMPPPPWIIQDSSIETPFAAADIPFASEATKKAVKYASYSSSKALALTPLGTTYSFTGEISGQAAARRALESCGERASAACIIIAIDDVFVVPIPKLVKVVGLFQPQALTAIAPALREDLARQLASSQKGWNVVAIGADGHAGIKLGAASEQAAIDGAMAACTKQDHDCHVTVVGPFLTYREPPKAGSEDQAHPTDSKLLVPDLVPFISDIDRATIRDVYMPAPDYKALALGTLFDVFVTGQADQQTADAAAMSACQKRSAYRASQGLQSFNTCDLYASGNIVVTSRAHPPMPPRPWLIRDPSIESPFVAADFPMVKRIDDVLTSYPSYKKSKGIALAPSGRVQIYNSDTSPEQVARRVLERCGFDANVACMLIAVDDVFVVPIPRSAKVIGFFEPSTLTGVAPELRDDMARQLKNSASGWNAVAVGANGRFGLGLGAPSEQTAIDQAMTACNQQDHDCSIAAIGPFLVERGSPLAAATEPH
jgi:hypothetical protein